MRIGETRKKRYVLAIDDTSAIMRTINVLEDISEDDDIEDAIQSEASATVRDALDILRAVLNNDCEEFDLGNE